MGTENILTYGHRKLAIFMGGEPIRTENYTMPHGSNSEGTVTYWKIPTGTPIHRREFAHIGMFDYSSNWASIHAVIDRIEGLGYEVIISRRKIQIWKFDPTRLEYEVTGRIVNEDLLDDYVGDNKTMMVFAALVQFVEWYNKHNEDTEKPVQPSQP